MKNLLSFILLFSLLETCNVDTSNLDNKKQDTLYISMLGTSKQIPDAVLPGSNSINIGGKITGLGSGKTVTLELNGNKTTLLTENKLYQVYFTNHPKGTNYELTVKETTGDILCSIQNSSGVAETDITDADVSCTLANPPPPPSIFYTVGGTVSGLTGSITLSMSGSVSQTKTISTNGSYTFDTQVPENGNYSVTISVHSTTSFCYFPNANANHNAAQTGTATNNVTNVNLTCVGRLTLNEICSNSCGTGSPGSPSGKDFIELKNISGALVTINNNEWYVCDMDGSGNCGTSFNASSLESTPPSNLKPWPATTVPVNGYTTLLDNGQMFGLGSTDGVYLIYKSGTKYYLVEQYPSSGTWSSHVIPARKYPDGDFSGTTNSGYWSTNGPITYGIANPNTP